MQAMDCVCLYTDDCSPDADDGERGIFLCVKVPNCVVSHSAVLEGFRGTAGMARLPPDVSSSDFLLWRNSRLHLPPEPIHDLARVVQVMFPAFRFRSRWQ